MEPLVVVAVAGVALGGLAQSVTGLGFALVAAPALIAVLGPRQGVGVVVLLGTLASVLPLMSHWRRVRVRDTATLLVPTLLATPVVAALLRGMDTATVAVAAGVAVLVGVVHSGVASPGIGSCPSPGLSGPGSPAPRST